MKDKKCKHKVLYFIVIIIFAAVILIFTVYSTKSPFSKYDKFKYDNETPLSYDESRKYSENEIDKLQNGIWAWEIDFRQFNKKYKPQCIRKTPQGYYAVLVQEDYSLCFVFWNSENRLYCTYRTDGLVPSEEFKSRIVIGKSSLESIMSSGFDFFPFLISKITVTGHICSDGVLVVKYNENCIAQSTEFYSNEELSSKPTEFPAEDVPYILPQDKAKIGSYK